MITLEPGTEPQEYYTPEELAIKLRVSIYTVYRRLQQENIDHYRIGNQYRISNKQVSEYLERVKNKKRGEE